ncbi:IGS10 protein, partial [Eolophus roseicapillus]|nr:IGS10 protein [Eolophus roseicapilla]
EDGRIIVVKTGTFTLRTADTFDTGLYHCIGTNYNDADTLTFRITVVDPYVEHSNVNGAQLSTFVGSTLYLPCTSTAVPDASISWVLPEHVILHHSVRNKHIFDNGTLKIQGVTEQDSGYFRCVAANQYGVDLLVFQVLVRKDETALKKKQIAVGEWEEGDGSGNAMLASATTQKHPLATLATLTANRESAASAFRNRIAQTAYKRNSYRNTTFRHYRDKISRRLRGHRRQFVSSARRVDPQRWSAFLEKTKRNSTWIENRGEVATNPPVEVHKFSELPGIEEETSGDLVSLEEEFMIPVTETVPVSTLGRATENTVTAAPEMTMSNTPARKTSLLVSEAVTPLPYPFSKSVSSDSRRPQTYLKPTITNSWERSDLSLISAGGVKQSTVSNGASRTSTVLPAGQRLVYPGESNNQHLKSVSVTPMTEVIDISKSVTSQNAVDKLHDFTESIDKIANKTDHQISVVTVSEPSPEFGYIYFPSTQKLVTPEPLLASTIITHQQIQIIQNITTRTSQAQQQYGRRRKISGRRRIVRPGRIPSMKEHRYNLGRPGSVRGSTAVAADVQLNMKYMSDLTTLNNISSSINPLSPEAPLSSPSITNMPLEHPAGTQQNTVFLRKEENEASEREKATTVMPFIMKDTPDTPEWKLQSSAPFQTGTDRVQPFTIRLPTTATHTAHVAADITYTISTKVSSTLESVSPGIKPRTSPKNSQRGESTRELLFGNGAQKNVLKKLPEQQTDKFPSTEVSTMHPKTTTSLSVFKTSPLHFMPISTGRNHSNGFLSLNKPIHYGNAKSEEHLHTAKLHSSSNPATSATKEMDVIHLKPTVQPIIAPQTDTKITKSKTYRMGKKRGQRRKRPLSTSTSQSMTAGHSTAVILPMNTAMPAMTTVKSLTMPTSLTPAKPLSESVSEVSVAEVPALWIFNTPEAPQLTPAAGMQMLATPVTWRKIQSATLPQNPTTPIQTTSELSKPFSIPSTRPATAWAAAGSEPAQQIEATTTAGEQSWPKPEKSVTQDNHVIQPTLPARTVSLSAPAASTDITPASTQHPTPPP